MSSTCPRFGVLVLTIFMTVASAGTSYAHDIWLTLTGGTSDRRVVINYGHPGDRPPALADKIVDLVAISANGQTSLVAGLSHGVVRGAPVALSRPFPDDGKLLLAVTYDNGYWVKGSDGLYRNASRRIVPGATESLWSRKYGKALTGPGTPWNRIVGHELEIVPDSDPAAAKPGDTLRVRVLFRGAPLPNAKVEHDSGKATTERTSDAEGMISIPIGRAGAHTLSVGHRVTPSSAPELADADIFGATLSFTAPRSSLSDWLDLVR